jgi:hypothetical protein
MSLFCAAESPNRFTGIINTTFEAALCQMVLHRPVELAQIIGQADFAGLSWVG